MLLAAHAAISEIVSIKYKVAVAAWIAFFYIPRVQRKDTTIYLFMLIYEIVTNIAIVRTNGAILQGYYLHI